jgi:hypothetical protein
MSNGGCGGGGNGKGSRNMEVSTSVIRSIKLLFFRACVGMVSGGPDDLLLLAVFISK